MYISKDALVEIKNLDIPNNLKEDIDNIINKGPSCEFCGNTIYVNTFPYTLKDLNGDEKLELMIYARKNMKVLY